MAEEPAGGNFPHLHHVRHPVLRQEGEEFIAQFEMRLEPKGVK